MFRLLRQNDDSRRQNADPEQRPLVEEGTSNINHCRQHAPYVTRTFILLTSVTLLALYLNKILSLFTPTLRQSFYEPQLPDPLADFQITPPYSRDELSRALDNSDDLNMFEFAFSRLCETIQGCLVPQTPRATQLLNTANDTCRLYIATGQTSSGIYLCIVICTLIALCSRLKNTTPVRETHYQEDHTNSMTIIGIEDGEVIAASLRQPCLGAGGR